MEGLQGPRRHDLASAVHAHTDQLRSGVRHAGTAFAGVGVRVGVCGVGGYCEGCRRERVGVFWVRDALCFMVERKGKDQNELGRLCLYAETVS